MTLVEVLIALGIASMALAAVLSSLIFISRSTLASTDYAGMDMEARANSAGLTCCGLAK